MSDPQCYKYSSSPQCMQKSSVVHNLCTQAPTALFSWDEPFQSDKHSQPNVLTAVLRSCFASWAPNSAADVRALCCFYHRLKTNHNRDARATVATLWSECTIRQALLPWLQVCRATIRLLHHFFSWIADINVWNQAKQVKLNSVRRVFLATEICVKSKDADPSAVTTLSE